MRGVPKIAGPLVLFALLATACSQSPPVLTVPAGPPIPLPQCPATAPAGKATPAGASSVLIPDGPTSARLCRYAGLNGNGVPVDHLASAALVPPASLNQIVTDLDAVHGALPPGPINCPADDESSDVLILAYPQGQPVYVTIHPTGCATANNGTVQVAFFGDTAARGDQALTLLDAIATPSASATPTS